jgi:membrane associated rhomboid family serine protease
MTVTQGGENGYESGQFWQAQRGRRPSAPTDGRPRFVYGNRHTSDEGNPGVIAQLPWLTFVLCVTLIFKFNTELRASVDYSAPYTPGHFSLLALGASSRSQILGAGEWWRLFTAPVLHASPSHLIGNLIALLVAGWMLEPLVGIGWFGAIYFLGGFSGAVVSMLQNAADAQSVGASGAIMSCLACMFALSFHDGVRKPKLMRQLSGALLFPALRSSVTTARSLTSVRIWAA